MNDGAVMWARIKSMTIEYGKVELVINNIFPLFGICVNARMDEIRFKLALGKTLRGHGGEIDAVGNGCAAVGFAGDIKTETL